MRKIILSTLVILIGLNLYSQKKVSTVSLIGKTDTTYKFVITGKNLDKELNKLETTFGKPSCGSKGEIIWNKIEIPSIGKDLQLKLIDGLLTAKGDNAKFKAFKNTKNKSKSCQLKCMDENQNRQLYFTVRDKDNNNIINNEIKKKAVIKYLEDIIK